MVFDYNALGIAKPRAWHQPPCRIYESNSSAGSFYYEPMLKYIDRKSFMGADVASKAVQVEHIRNRQRIEFPHPHEMTNNKVTGGADNGPLRLGDFLVTFRAKQMKQRNNKTVRVKNEMVRHSKSAETIDDKRTSTVIRDKYINMLSLMYHGGIGKMESVPEIDY